MLYEMIATETDIDRRYQTIYFEKTNIEHLSLDTTIKDLPVTSRENPLLLISTIDVDIFNSSRIQNGEFNMHVYDIHVTAVFF